MRRITSDMQPIFNTTLLYQRGPGFFCYFKLHVYIGKSKTDCDIPQYLHLGAALFYTLFFMEK